MPLRLPAGASMSQRCASALTAGVLLLALFNVTFRLHRQPVQEWDESLYATSAWEMLQSGQWVAHTFRGEIDYYNTKPPLNIWLIVLSFKAFGVGLVSLRVASVLASLVHGRRPAVVGAQALRRADRALRRPGALLDVRLLLRPLGPHGEHGCHQHVAHRADGRHGVGGARRRGGGCSGSGPIMAAVFLLRGMAVIMPLAIALVAPGMEPAVEAGPPRPGRRRARPVPAAGRRVDASAMADRRLGDSSSACSGTTSSRARRRTSKTIRVQCLLLPQHPAEAPLRLARRRPRGVAALPGSSRSTPSDWAGRFARGRARSRCWPRGALVAFAIPTLMSTKIAWYLHPSTRCSPSPWAPSWPMPRPRPRGSGAARWRRACAGRGRRARRRLSRKAGWSGTRTTTGTCTAIRRDWLLDERDALKGRQVFRAQLGPRRHLRRRSRGRRQHRLAPDLADFLRDSQPGDYYRTSAPLAHEAVTLVRVEPARAPLQANRMSARHR